MEWIMAGMICLLCLIARNNAYDTMPSFLPTVTPIKATRYPTAFPTPEFTPLPGAPTYLPTNPKITEISCRQAIQGLNLSIASSMSFQSALSSTIAYVTSVDSQNVVIAPVDAYNFVCTIKNGCHIMMAYTVVAINIPTTILGGRLNSAIASGVFNNTLWANTGLTTISAIAAVSLVDISPTFSPTIRPTISPTTYSPSQSTLSEFGNLGTIVGITVGSVVGIAIIIVIYLCCCRKVEKYIEEKRSQRIVPGDIDENGEQEMKGELSPDTISVLDRPNTSTTIDGDKEKDNGYTRKPHMVVDLAGHIIVEGEENHEDKKKVLSRDWSIQSIRSSQFFSSFRSESFQWSVSSRRDSHSQQQSSKSPYQASSRSQQPSLHSPYHTSSPGQDTVIGFHHSPSLDSVVGQQPPPQQPQQPPKSSVPKTSVYEIFRRGSSAYLSGSPDRMDLSSHHNNDNHVNLFHQSPDQQRSSPLHRSSDL